MDEIYGRPGFSRQAFFWRTRELFIVGPHPDDFNGLNLIHDLIHQPVLDVDPSGVRTGKIADEFFVWRRILVRIFFEEFEQPFSLRFQSGLRDLFRILLGLLGKNQTPAHHSSFSLLSSTGLLSPS